MNLVEKIFSHDTQTTHWDSPLGARQHKHLKILQEHIDRVKQNIEVLFVRS